MKRFYKELIKKALLSTFIVLFSMISFATTYYVSNAGSDGANGLTANTAWATLAYAEANATTAGCIIALKKGDTWLIDNVLDINSGGTVGKPIVWDGSLWGTGANAIIQANSDGGAVPKYYTICKISGCSYVTFQNITINGNNKYRTGIVVGGSHLVYGPTQQNNESNIIIQGCSILNCGNNLNYTQGILIETWNNDISDITIQRNIVDGTDTETIAIYNGRSDLGATPSEVSNCYIGYNTCTNFGRKGSFGIGVQINNKVTNTIVEHNTITTGASGFGHGLSCESNEPNTGYFPTNITYRYNDVRVTTRSAFLAQSGQAKTALVHNNLFYSANPLNGVIAINASASPAWTGALLKFYNNTIVHAEGYGYVSDSNVASTCEFKNNIVVRNVANTNAAMLNISNANSTIKNNNCYYRTSGTRIAVIAGGSKFAADMATIEPTAVLGNPLLTNLATYDFHLQAGSPTIDAGNPSSAFDSDGTRADIGALYYNHTVVNTLPTAYNVTGGGSYCNGGSGVAIGLSNSQTGVNYQLKLNGVNNVTALAGTGSVLSFGNKTVAGNYTVVATNVSTSVIANMTGSAIVTVNPLPTVTITGETTPVSLGSTGNVYTTQSGMSNYLWNVSAGGIVTSGGGSSNNTVTVTWNTAGVQSISVNYTNATGCTASSATNYPVTVNSLPTTYNVTGGGSYCNGGSGVTVGLSNSQIGVNYQLQLGGVNNGTALAGSGSAISFGNKIVAGTYTVVATNVSTSATANMTGSATVTVNPLPAVTIAGGITPLAGSMGNVYTTEAGMSNYIWIVSAGGIVTSGGGTSNNTVTVTWNTAGAQSISVNYTNATGCTASSATNYPVTVNSLPTTYNVTGGGSYCNGGSGVAVVLSNSQIGVNYQLQLGGINNGTTLAGSGNAINFGNKTAAGNYTVVATNVSTLLTANMTGSATVAVNPIYSIIENITIKQGQVYNSWTQSGQYMRTLSSISGCDSIVTTNLNVIAPELLTEYKSICEGSNYNGWVISGKYERTLIAASGGDIIITTYLTVNPKYAINENITITEGGTYQGWTTSGQYTRTLMSISGCDSIVTTNLTVEKLVIKGGGIAPVHFITSWNGLTGLNLMNITVASAILEDLPLSTDDEIAVFSGTSCVGAKKLTQSINLSDNSTFLSIPASQNDGSNNGFNTIDTIIFKIWDNKNQKEMIAKAVTYRHDLSTWLTTGKYAPGALSTVEIVSYTEYTQTIQLKKGNNLFSTYVTPTNPNVSVVMKSLVTQKALIKMQDEAGNSFENWGSFGGWINNVGSIEITEGYKMKVANNCTLNVTGRLIALPLDISLKTGWNIISFPHTDMIDAMSVIQSLIELNKLVKVQDEIGNSIENWGISGGWKNGIGYFIPGKAYKVKMNADAIITIQQNYTKSAVIMATTEKTDHFLTGIEGNGTDHMNINLVSLNESDLVIGDELAAFDGDICVGTLKITESHLVNGSASLIASFSTDDKNKDGFKEGNQIQIIAWNHLSGNESKVEAELVNGQMSYEKNASVLVQMESLSTGIKGFEDLVTINVFPNPSKGRITIRFSEIPDAGSRIDILDISGRKVTSRLITGTSEEFNLDQQPAGIYLVKSIIDSKEKIHKLIITK